MPGVNNLGTYGRWASAEFTDVFQMQDDFAQKVEAEFNKMIYKYSNDRISIQNQADSLQAEPGRVKP